MGYCIRVCDIKFHVKEVKKESALKAIRALHGKETIRDSSGNHFSWVRTEDFLKAGTLEDMLRIWRWEPTTDTETGDITDLDFTGEKMGDDVFLFRALSPFVESGGEIIFKGEDGEMWKYKFDGEKMKEVKSRRIWENEE